MRRSARGALLALGLLTLAGPVSAADPYIVDLVRALREFGSRVGIPSFVIHDIGATYDKTFRRVWRDLEIAMDQGFGTRLGARVPTDPAWLDAQAAAMEAVMAKATGEDLDFDGPLDPSATCTEPPPWTPPPRPEGWRPTVRPWVRQLQEMLRVQGHYQDEVDGLFGPNTRAAVYRYQCAEGLPGEGLTRRTAARLGVTLP